MARSEGLVVEPSVAATAEMLQDREALGLVAMERAGMPIIIADAQQADMPIVMANQAFLDLTGYAAEEIVGRNCRFLQGPDSSPVAVQHLREGLARRVAVDVELLNYRKDGTSFWNAIHLSPVFDRTGRLIY